MKKKVRIVITVILAAILVLCAGMIIYKNIQYSEGAETYAEAEKLAGLPDLTVIEGAQEPAAADDATSETPKPDSQAVPYVDPYADLLRNMDFAALRKVNSDVLGWILIPNTAISYPLVKTDDNSYYLNRDYKKAYSAVGAIFMEQACSPDFSDFNTIIYGHRMNNGSMFAGLKYYKSNTYWKSHPYVYVTTDSGCSKYEIFAAYEISTEGDTYRLGIKNTSTKQAYIDYCVGQSLYSTGVTPTTNDHILTLSTCTGNGHATRWVVQAVLKSAVAPDAAAEETPTTQGERDSASGENTDNAGNDENAQRSGEQDTQVGAEHSETQTDSTADTETSTAGTTENAEAG